MTKTKWTKINNLEWSEDLGEMNWEKAKAKCEELGGRLPTRLELIDLYDNHWGECKTMHNFLYWSSTEYNSYYAWNVHFNVGSVEYSNETNSFLVRCVRPIKN